MNKMVSIIIPTYNRSALVAEAIQSCITQTYRPIECIVVDDGSTDNTHEIVQIMQNSTDEEFILKYILQPNSGSQVARNTGTALAKGQFIQYLDSDDLLCPNKIQLQVDYLKSNPDCDGVFGDWLVGSVEENETVIAYKSEDFLAQILTNRCIHTLSFLMTRKIVEIIGPWDVAVKRNQEIDFHLRGVLAGGNFEYFSCITGLWRIHIGERISNKTNFSAAIYFYKKWERILKENNMWAEEFKIGFVNSYLWFLGNYPNSNYSEFKKLLYEIKRLQPSHAVFKSRKFKFIKLIFSLNIALSFWIFSFKSSVKS